jgi:hypothetical protein
MRPKDGWLIKMLDNRESCCKEKDKHKLNISLDCLFIYKENTKQHQIKMSQK